MLEYVGVMKFTSILLFGLILVKLLLELCEIASSKR